MGFKTERPSRRYRAVEVLEFRFRTPPPLQTPKLVRMDSFKRDGTSMAYPERCTATALVDRAGRVYVGVSLCWPTDQFVIKVGRDKSRGYAFAQLLKAMIPTAKLDPEAKDLSDQVIKVMKEEISATRQEILTAIATRKAAKEAKKAAKAAQK